LSPRGLSVIVEDESECAAFLTNSGYGQPNREPL
jgi:hypothetical protein